MKLYSVLIFLFSCSCFAQYSSEYETYKLKYPDSRSVKLHQETLIEVTLKNDQISIHKNFSEEDLYLDESATYNSKGSLDFGSFLEISDIEASSFSFESGKYRETKVETFKEKDEFGESFYDDVKSINFIYPNLKEGSKSQLKYKEKIKNPRFLNSMYLGDFHPIINNKITIIADKNIELDFKEYNLENLDIKFNKESKRKTNVYTWEIKNVDKYAYEEQVPSYQKILPHIIPIIKSYTLNGEKIPLLNEVSDLYKWYYSLVKDVNLANSDAELVDLVNEVIKGKESDLEKVRAIYYWVQKNIKYVAFEYALGGFIPREANDVFKKKYGDCKDNSSLLNEMLKIADLKGSLTWVGTRKIPYRYEELPTPKVDNHMILAYTNNGETYFLDATGRYVPLELPTSFIQGKEALIANGEDNFEIKKVPVVAAKKNAFKDVTLINIVGDNIVGKTTTRLSGYKKIDFFNYLESIKTEEKVKEFYNYTLQKGNNKFKIINFKESNKYDYDKEFIIDYDFEIQNFTKSIANELYVNLNLNKTLSNFRISKERKNEIECEYKRVYDYTLILDIPEGYKVGYLPENSSLINEFITFEAHYEVTGDKITYRQQFKIDYLSLNLEEQKEVNAIIKKVEKYFNEIVVLKKNNKLIQ